VHFWIELPSGLPEHGERGAFPGVIPHTRGDYPTGRGHALHLAQTGYRVSHEMNDELCECCIEAGVVEGNALSRSVAHVDAWMATFRCGDKWFGRVEGRNVSFSEPPNEFGRQGARPAANVQRSLRGTNSAEVGELWRQLRRVPAHEPVIGLGRDLECHSAESNSHRLGRPSRTLKHDADDNQGGTVSRLRFHISMSLDGFIAGPNQSEENPLGEGGMQLHEWVFGLAAWRQSHGQQGGEVNASTDVVEGSLENIGATVMGRNMFGGKGPWGDDPWDGWWGDNPPFHMPVFIVTHHAREPVSKEGGTTFTFVTDGIESALEHARAAAGGKDVALGGGANVAQQYVKAGLIDEMRISLVPLLLGAGAQLFDNLEGAEVKLECIRAVDAPGVTHLTYRFLR
jgi:dihydrofolate reductase